MATITIVCGDGEVLRIEDDAKLEATIKRISAKKAQDLTKARLIFQDGYVEAYEDQKLAYKIWLAMPKGTRVAFRGIGEAEPVYPWDCVDKP